MPAPRTAAPGRRRLRRRASTRPGSRRPNVSRVVGLQEQVVAPPVGAEHAGDARVDRKQGQRDPVGRQDAQRAPARVAQRRGGGRARRPRRDPRPVEQEARDGEERIGPSAPSYGRRRRRAPGARSAPETRTRRGTRAPRARRCRGARRRAGSAGCRAAARPRARAPVRRPDQRRAGPGRGRAGRRRRTRPSRGSSGHALPRARRSASSAPAGRGAERAGDASTVGAAGIRFGEIAASAPAVLFSKEFVTVSIPAEAISIGTRLGCGVYISARPTSWSRSTLRVVVLAGAGQQLERGPAAQRRRRRPARRCRCRAAPSRRRTRRRSSRPGQREHAELEHVARGVRLGAGVEQQPARRSARPARGASAAARR